MIVANLIKSYWGEIVFVFSNTYSLALSFVASIIATAFIDPLDMGIIQAVLLVQVYISFLQLGVFNGLNRNLAYYKAKGDAELVQDMVNTTYTVSYVVALIGFVLSLVVFFFFLVTGRPIIYLLSSVLLGLFLIFVPLSNAIETTYRSGQEFKKLGVIKNYETTLYAGLSLLPIILGYLGKIIADGTKNIIGYIMRYTKRPYHQTGIGSKSSLFLLIRTGLPMLISGYVWTVFLTCDSTYIARNLGMENLGLYSIANYVIMALMMVPSALNSLLYPKASARYGASGNVNCLKEFWKKSLLLYIVILVPLSIMLYFILPYMVEYLMPKYTNGVKAAQYSLLSCMTFISMGPAVLFGTLRRNTLNIIVLSLSVVLFWGIAMLFSDSFRTIESVSLLRFVISFFQMIIVLVLTYKYVNK